QLLLESLQHWSQSVPLHKTLLLIKLIQNSPFQTLIILYLKMDNKSLIFFWRPKNNTLSAISSLFTNSNAVCVSGPSPTNISLARFFSDTNANVRITSSI